MIKESPKTFYTIILIEKEFVVRQHNKVTQSTSYVQVFPSIEQAEKFIEKKSNIIPILRNVFSTILIVSFFLLLPTTVFASEQICQEIPTPTIAITPTDTPSPSTSPSDSHDTPQSSTTNAPDVCVPLPSTEVPANFHIYRNGTMVLAKWLPDTQFPEVVIWYGHNGKGVEYSTIRPNTG